MRNLPVATKTMGVRLFTGAVIIIPAIWFSDFVIRAGIAAVGLLLVWPVMGYVYNCRLVSRACVAARTAGRVELAADIYQRQVEQGYTID